MLWSYRIWNKSQLKHVTICKILIEESWVHVWSAVVTRLLKVLDRSKTTKICRAENHDEAHRLIEKRKEKKGFIHSLIEASIHFFNSIVTKPQ
jgi:hypothetical protein